jgi:hypothetical protein
MQGVVWHGWARPGKAQHGMAWRGIYHVDKCIMKQTGWQ